MKKYIKLISIIIIVFIMTMTLVNISYADLTDPIQNPDSYKPTENAGGTTKLKDMANDIIGALKAIGTVSAVVILMIMGYKYMIASAEEKAGFKQSMIPYLIGAIMLFTIPTFVGIIYDLTRGINF